MARLPLRCDNLPSQTSTGERARGERRRYRLPPAAFFSHATVTGARRARARRGPVFPHGAFERGVLPVLWRALSHQCKMSFSWVGDASRLRSVDVTFQFPGDFAAP
jgi:hypothetical protein